LVRGVPGCADAREPSSDTEREELEPKWSEISLDILALAASLLRLLWTLTGVKRGLQCTSVDFLSAAGTAEGSAAGKPFVGWGWKVLAGVQGLDG